MDNRENETLEQLNMTNSESTVAPVEPVQPVVTPVEPVMEPVQPFVTPVEPVVEPVQSVVTPVEPVVEPVQPVVTSVEPVMEPVQPFVTPVEPVVEPVQPVVTSVQPMMNNVNAGVTNNQPIMNNVNPGMVNPQPVMNQGNIGNQGSGNSVTNLLKKIDKNVIIAIGGVIAIVAVGVIGFNFAGKKTLNCTMSEDNYGMTINSNFDLVYRGNNVNKMQMTMEVDLGDYVEYKDAMLESFESQFQDQIDEINEQGGKASISSTDDSILIEISASRDGISTMLSVDEDDDYSYDEMKKELEDMGYTCK